jgi:hypothetical protein
MKYLSSALVAVTLTVSAFATSDFARAENGQVAAGVAGGLLGGLLLGGALAPRPYYYAPAPVYVEPAPVYVERPYRCYWTRGEPVWDDYRGIWRRPQVQVCD